MPNGRLADPPTGAGLLTVTGSDAACVKLAKEITTDKWFESINVGLFNGIMPKRTVELGVKFDPINVTVVLSDPTGTALGVSCVRVGVGLSAASTCRLTGIVRVVFNVWSELTVIEPA